MPATHNASEQPVAKVGDVWFRYEQRTYGSLDEFEIIVSTRHELELMEFKVAKVTPKGVWLERYLGNRFVRASGRRRFAHPTKDAALESFRQRKLRQIELLQAQLSVAKTMLARADGMQNRVPSMAYPASLEHLGCPAELPVA